jgi:hypothetical protein
VLGYIRLPTEELERRGWAGVVSPIAPIKLEEDESDPKSDPPGV